jgi:hypothetical protein
MVAVNNPALILALRTVMDLGVHVDKIDSWSLQPCLEFIYEFREW